MEDKRRDTARSQAPPSSSSTPVKSGDNLPPPPQATPVSRRRLKRKSTNFNSSSSSSAKRLAREKANLSLLPPIHNGPLTRARQLSDNAAYSSALNAVKNEASSAFTAQGDSTGGNQCYEDVIDKEYEPLEAAIEAEFEVIRNRDSNAHVVPIPAGWYSWTKIHPIEKQALPSFFNSKSESRSPEIYMGIRNWIMKKFHANPNSSIELKDLADLSIGELDARQEVMECLELWGLINYHPLPPKDVSMATENAGTDGNQDEKMDSLIEQLYRFENERSARSPVPKTNLAAPSGWFHESALAEELVKQDGPAVEYHCNSCQADCSRKMYHCQKQADFDLCSDCYNSGKFGSDMSPLDFILMEPGEAGASGGKWTDQETLLLLEALELFKENWNEIAEHVATKTKAQCILHFLQMPIEDPFLDNDAEVKDSLQENDSSISKDAPETSKIPEDPNATIDDSSVKEASDMSKCQTGNDSQPITMGASNSEANQDVKGDADIVDNFALTALKQAFDVVGLPLTDEDKLPFSEAGNPVMALVAFLAHLVEPGPATASARCAVKSISSGSSIPPPMQLALRHCFILDDPPDDRTEHTVSDSADTERTEQVACKEEKQDDKNKKDMNHNKEQTRKQDEESPANQNEEKPSDQDEEKNAQQGEENPLNLDEQESTTVLDGSHITTDHVDDKTEHSAMEEDPPVHSQVEYKSIEKSQASEKTELHNHEQLGPPKVLNEPESSDSLKEQPLNHVKKSDDSALCLNHPPSSAQQSKDSDSAIQATHSVESQMDVQMEPAKLIETPKDKDREPAQCAEAPKDVDKEPAQCADAPKFVDNEPDQHAEALKNVDKEPDQHAEAPKNVDMEHNEEQNQDQAVADVGVVCFAKTGEDSIKPAKTGDPKSTDSTDDPSVDKLKRAAVTTIAAAAVKAKLLADQEEDEVRQLTASLIDKQLRKIEVKLSFFSEMEEAVMRLKGQLERPRQKLYHERAQIIAARYGVPASSSRMMPSTVPANRIAMGVTNPVPRPMINLVPQRPSVPRPSMASGPQTSNTYAPSVVGGRSSTQPSGQ